MIAADREAAGSRADNVQVFAELQLAAGQRDRLTIEIGVKENAVSAACGSDPVPQRPSAVVRRRGDRENGRRKPALERLQLKPAAMAYRPSHRWSCLSTTNH